MFHIHEKRLRAFKKRLLKKDPTKVNTGWEDILIPQGIAIAGTAWNDEELLAWNARWVAHHASAAVKEDPVGYVRPGDIVQGVVLAQYSGNWGFPLAFGRRIPDSRSLEICIQVSDYILNNARRLPDGSLVHGGGEDATVWVDTLYFASSVLAETFALSGDERYAVEAVRQLNLHASHLRDPITGAFFHDCNPATMSRSSSFWSRGNGWVILAYADTLRCCPPTTEGWREAMTVYQSLVSALLRWQHPSGLWRIIPECPEAHLETSGTAMIATGISIGAAEGWIEPSMACHAWSATAGLFPWIGDSGALTGAQCPAGVGGWETHRRSAMRECTYASGLFLRLLGELKSYNLITSNNENFPG